MRTGRMSEGRIISEREILQSYVKEGHEFDTDILMIPPPSEQITNRVGEDKLGLFRDPSARKAVIADMELLRAFTEKGLKVPSFLEAGPRAVLRHNPREVKAAIVTTGGLAPGLHCVIHSIVSRHCRTYGIARGKVLGVYNSFRGLCALADNQIELNPIKTEEWLDQGGSKLGIMRGEKKGEEALAEMVDLITKNLESNNIDILYVIGGDGTLRATHQIALANPTRSVVGIPKTMDNDVLWVWQSFGFDTAVEQATRVINTLHSEAEGTRRVGIIELFGADSGFVAANATLASGHVDLVLIPEVFYLLNEEEATDYLDEVVNHIRKAVQDRDNSATHDPHAVAVVAEGVGHALEVKKNGVFIQGTRVTKENFVKLLTKMIEKRVHDAHRQSVPVFENQPRHYIRSLPANPHDQIYCERLGALAVDNALGGYTDFMISKWLTEFVLVPLALVGSGQKSIPVNGMFWKQVVSSTDQPLSPAERPSLQKLEQQPSADVAVKNVP
jgi:6-phosphofructokinase 1